MRLVLRVSTTIYRSRSWWRATRNSKRTGRVYAGGKRVDHTLDYTYKEEVHVHFASGWGMLQLVTNLVDAELGHVSCPSSSVRCELNQSHFPSSKTSNEILVRLYT
ncbi:hypothetical protein PF002_g16318 [Phytophthora fragariae]|uniref:Uncharacterized protein n=1 Tax=Phytophthora fragariae TaxID=53985 RepID=A0A6A3YIL9_9STRA|nr:hypothetical protein PF002_g16318 [Phytophthora fragariae]KAE9304500.1 hypothetical protein PF008_g21953 [Phytophthora fragariae]